VSDTVIRIENLGKKYVLGHQKSGGYTTLRDRLTYSTQSLIQNLTPGGKRRTNPVREEFWALQDVYCEIQQGDRIGIIGRNGAGKSTLLKLLSRITEPTKGRISIQGRVASLLEVGTGFHPELTGRENIYLNGAILGMSKAEIKQNFDEIVAFAEVEKFLDTPVKHYSSGMYVRLAFAVAAHLEPEILIVDEVLAVGDAQFQKKCLGKMQDVSQQQGRTVLFVSHNMDAIQRLCSQCLLLESGRLIAHGNTASIAGQYLSSHCFKASPDDRIELSQGNRIGTGEARFVSVQYSSLNSVAGFQPYSNGPLEFILGIESDSARIVGSLAVTLYNQAGVKMVNADIVSLGRSIVLREGYNTVKIKIQKLYLNPDIYVVGLWLAKMSESAAEINDSATKINDSAENSVLDYVESAFEIEVINLASERLGIHYNSDDGAVFCSFEVVEGDE
jgi:lipopolysaccharide transport system ATP-binding protein